MGTTVTVLVWTVLQVVLLAVALGSADYATGRTTLVSPTGYTVAGAGVAAVAVGAGAMTSGRLLSLREVSTRASQRVAGAQSAAVTVVVVLHGLLAARPSLTAVAALVLGAAVGGLGGTALGTRGPRGSSGAGRQGWRWSRGASG